MNRKLWQLVAAIVLLTPAGAQAEIFTIGDTTSNWSAGPYYRGNAYLADEEVILEYFEVYLGLSSACDLDFYLHSGPSDRGPWTVVWYNRVSAAAATGFFNSGAVDEVLSPGTHYALGVGWNCTVRYYGHSGTHGGDDAGVGDFEANLWSNSYAFSATFVPPNHGGATLAYYHNYSIAPPDMDGDGWSTTDGDCDDTLDTVYPGAAEACDGIDNDCDGDIDEGFALSTYYADLDGDGYGDDGSSTLACAAPPGHIATGGDCDDDCASCHPGGTEICDEHDNDCDGLIDDGVGATTYYRDSDGDGFGVDSTAVTTCADMPGYATVGGDCNDGCAECNPAAVEICDLLDNNCDGVVDEGLAVTIYADSDGDGYGNAASGRDDCEVPVGYVENGDDCHDMNADIHPGAEEVCDDADNNCDGEIDEGLLVTYYEDFDGDGFGDAATAAEGCVMPEGNVDNGDDCDDTLAAVNPDAEEILLDGIDNDCDGEVDEDPAADGDGDTDGDSDGDSDVDGDGDGDGDGDADGDADGDGDADSPTLTADGCQCRAGARRSFLSIILAALLSL